MREPGTFKFRKIANGLFTVEGSFGGAELDYFASSPIYGKHQEGLDPTEPPDRPLESNPQNRSADLPKF